MAEFLAGCPGIGSRFSHTVHFADYTAEQLIAILEQHATTGYEPTLETKALLLRYVEHAPRGRAFGNGRFARRLPDSMITRQAGRVCRIADPSIEDLTTLLPEDFVPPAPDRVGIGVRSRRSPMVSRATGGQRWVS
jgi:hypothetical protein